MKPIKCKKIDRIAMNTFANLLSERLLHRVALVAEVACEHETAIELAVACELESIEERLVLHWQT